MVVVVEGGGGPVRVSEKQEMAAFVLGRCFNLR